MNARHTSYFAILATFWGGSFLAIHYVVESFPPTFGAFLRVATAFIAIAIMRIIGPKDETPKNIKWQAFGAGLFNLGFPFIFLFYGEKFISPALAAIYNSTYIIFVALLTPIFLHGTRLTRKNILGVFIGFFGMLIIFGPNAIGQAHSQIIGQISLLGMAVCYSIGIIWVKRYGHQIRAVPNFFYQALAGLFVLAIHSAIFEAPWQINLSHIRPEAFISVLYLGICSTFISWLIFIRLIRERGALQASTVTYLVPMVSIILDWIILGKLVKPTDFLGIFIILTGVWLIQKRSLQN